jgi:minor histocompatibility antigen H13
MSSSSSSSTTTGGVVSTLNAVHLLLAINALLPLAMTYPHNVNVIVTASLTVFAGCVRSVKDAPPVESMTKKDAMKFPLVGSVMLFGLFLAFKFLPKDMVNLVLTLYFILLGTFGVIATVARLFDGVLDPKTHPLRKERKLTIPFLDELEFSMLDVLLMPAAVAFCYWYYQKKHWVANNVLGLAFSLQGVEHLSLGTVQNGVILLCGLFFYDVFWVFCTPVMVSVAKNFDAPIKLLFPKSLGSAEMSMLGLGDIVIPGIMVAIVLRYDVAHGGKVKYFSSAMIGYVAGIAATIVVMNVFDAAQPALLYIVPSVLGATFGHAWMNGDVETLLYWSEEADEKDDGAGAAGEKKKDTDDEDAADDDDAPSSGAAQRRTSARRRVRRD